MVVATENDYCMGKPRRATEEVRTEHNKKLDVVDDKERLCFLRNNIVGSGCTFEGPFGTKPIIYADWTASARAYKPIEDFIQQKVYPYYANTHTFTSTTGLQSTWYRAEARTIIQQAVNGNSKKDVVLFTGNVRIVKAVFYEFTLISV